MTPCQSSRNPKHSHAQGCTNLTSGRQRLHQTATKHDNPKNVTEVFPIHCGIHDLQEEDFVEVFPIYCGLHDLQEEDFVEVFPIHCGLHDLQEEDFVEVFPIHCGLHDLIECL